MTDKEREKPVKQTNGKSPVQKRPGPPKDPLRRDKNPPKPFK